MAGPLGAGPDKAGGIRAGCPPGDFDSTDRLLEEVGSTLEREAGNLQEEGILAGILLVARIDQVARTDQVEGTDPDRDKERLAGMRPLSVLMIISAKTKKNVVQSLEIYKKSSLKLLRFCDLAEIALIETTTGVEGNKFNRCST